MSRTNESLMAMYRAMHARFGHRAWWPAADGAPPGERKLEICVGAILTQNTNWRNVEKAIANLRLAGCMSVGDILAKPPAELAQIIRPAGYYNIKAKRLRNFASRVREAFGGDIEAFLARPVSALRDDLLSVNGIGRETADSIILYAAGLPTFVVDAYTARIGARHFLFAPEDDYDAIKDVFESAMPADAELFNDYHAQLVQTGKEFCRPLARCAGCPLEKFPHDAQL
jgi:endonuclease III related protein